MHLTNGLVRENDDALLKAIYPCLFFGVVLSQTPDQTKNTALERSSSLKPGQFILEHKHEGHACSVSNLFGVFLPVKSCPSPTIPEALIRISETFSSETRCALHPYLLTAPQKNVPGISELRIELGQLGPFEVRSVSHPDGTSEAFIRLDHPDLVLAWCKGNIFQFVVGLKAEGTTPVIKQEILPWANLKEFAAWLRQPKLDTSIDRIQAALLYKNSD